MPPLHKKRCEPMGENYTKRLERAKYRFLQSNVTSENKKKIIEFGEYSIAKDRSIKRQLKYFYTLKTIEKNFHKTFNKATKKDIEKFVSWVNTSDYAYSTKRDFKIILKIFYKWLREEEGYNFSKHEYPDEVKWISIEKKLNKKKLPQELLNIEEVKKLAENTYNLRDRAFILLLYESGGRIGEILNIKIKDIENDKYGSLIILSGKTGPRKIRVIASSPAVNNWLLEHSNRQDKNAFLFCGIWGKKRGEEIGYNTISKMLKKTAEKANINKPVNPHHFRHSRATELAKSFTESQLCEYLGWVQGSKEAATYVHLSGRDMDSAVLKMHGLVNEEEKQNKFTTITCPRCKTINDPSAKFCSQCSLGLDLQTVLNFEKTKDDFSTSLLNLIQDKELALKTLDALTKVLHNQ